ncbi:MAG: hypothetical protein ACKOJB_11520, partial [Chthoniobacterales bacterium]
LFAMFPVETERLLRGEKPAELKTGLQDNRPSGRQDNAVASVRATGGKAHAKKYVMHIEGKKHMVKVEEVA